MQSITTKDSAAWCEVFGVTVLDPDGWDRTNYEESWAEEITLAEFINRLTASSVSYNKEGGTVYVANGQEALWVASVLPGNYSVAIKDRAEQVKMIKLLRGMGLR